MTDRDRDLSRYCVPREAGAAFCATRDGHLSMVEPLTPRARAWLHAFVSGDATWLGPQLVVETATSPASPTLSSTQGSCSNARRSRTDADARPSCDLLRAGRYVGHGPAGHAHDVVRRGLLDEPGVEVDRLLHVVGRRGRKPGRDRAGQQAGGPRQRAERQLGHCVLDRVPHSLGRASSGDHGGNTTKRSTVAYRRPNGLGSGGPKLLCWNMITPGVAAGW